VIVKQQNSRSNGSALKLLLRSIRMVKPATIALIDDDEDDLDLLRTAIEGQYPGMPCIEFESGDRALSHLTACDHLNPAVIFIDVNMPRMAGDLCLKKLRALPKFAETKIYMISTSISDSMRLELQKHGASQVFEKPYDLKGYNHILHECLDAEFTGDRRA
jgi:CheY-like chemotaxis protein